MKKIFFILFIIVLSILFSKEDNLASITDFSGQVYVQSTDGKNIKSAAIIGRSINTGDIVIVLSGASCEISFKDKRTIVKIDSSSEVKFISKEMTREMYLRSGSLYVYNVNICGLYL